MPIPRPSHEELEAVMHREMSVYPPAGFDTQPAESASLVWFIGTLSALIAAVIAIILLF